MFDWLLNNPVVFALIIVAIVAIAVGLILYFLVFRKKIKAKKADNKVKHQVEEVKNQKSKELASEVFNKRETKAKQPSEEELKAFDEKLKKLVNKNKNEVINSKNFEKQVKKEEKPAEDNKKDYDIMSQFKTKK